MRPFSSFGTSMPYEIALLEPTLCHLRQFANNIRIPAGLGVSADFFWGIIGLFAPGKPLFPIAKVLAERSVSLTQMQSAHCTRFQGTLHDSTDAQVSWL